MISITQCCPSVERSRCPAIDDVNSSFKCEHVFSSLKRKYDYNKGSSCLGKSRKLILILALHFDNPLWCFLIAWLLQEGAGGLHEDKCLRNKKTFFCQSWKMALALFFFHNYYLNFLFLSVLLQKSPRKLLTLTEDQNMIYTDIMYNPSKFCFVKDCFMALK